MEATGINDVRSQWSEEKKKRVSILEEQHKKILDDVYATLNRRNQLASVRVADSVLGIQCQALVVAADLAGLIDALEGSGQIDRVDFMVRCVDRFQKMSKAIDASH